MPERACSKCHVPKPLTEYHRDSSRKDGHSATCKMCMAAYHAEYQKTDKWKDYHRKKQAAFRERHPDREPIYGKSRFVPLDDKCSRCGTSEKRLIGHHPDYTRPLYKITLCDKCHMAVHREMSNA